MSEETDVTKSAWRAWSVSARHSVRAYGQVDHKEHVEFDERGQEQEAGIDQRADQPDAPVQAELVQRQACVQRKQRRQQRYRAVYQPARVYAHLNVSNYIKFESPTIIRINIFWRKNTKEVFFR